MPNTHINSNNDNHSHHNNSIDTDWKCLCCGLSWKTVTRKSLLDFPDPHKTSKPPRRRNKRKSPLQTVNQLFVSSGGEA